MKRHLHIYIFCLTLIFCISSCTKDTDKFTPYSTSEFNDVSWSASPISLAKSQAIIAALFKSPFTANFNSNSNVVYNFNNQIQLSLPGNSYTLNGVNYNGSINVSLQQLSSKGDFIRNLIPSCNADNLFSSKSALLLNLTDNLKNSLSLSSGTSYSISLADSSINNVYLSGNAVTPSEGSVYWSVADSSSTGFLFPSNILMNNQTVLVNQITSKKLNWISFATPLQTGSLANSNIVLAAQNFTNKNTIVFAVFKDENIVLRLQPDYGKKVFLAQNLPIGSNIQLVSISYIDDKFYLGKQDIVVSNSLQYTINPYPSLTSSSLAEVNNFLDGL